MLELLLNEVIERHIPQKQKRFKKLKQPKWINESIVETIKQRSSENQKGIAFKNQLNVTKGAQVKFKKR